MKGTFESFQKLREDFSMWIGLELSLKIKSWSLAR